MARLKRLVVAGLAHHVLLRAAPGTAAFVDADDAARYLELFAGAAAKLRVEVHAYALLPGEVQALVTPHEGAALGRLMQSLGRSYTAAFNRRHGRQGALWSGRFQAAPVEPGAPLLERMRFIEQAPLRQARALRGPAAAWSSAAHHVGEANLKWITDHESFWRLGNTPFERQLAYAAVLGQAIGDERSGEIERAASKSWVLGSARFVDEIARRSGRRAEPLPRGRPRRTFEVAVNRIADQAPIK